MKYLILIGDGMAGRPLKELNDKTTLEVARKPAINALLQKGITGLVQNVPAGMPPGSDVASMSIFSYNPKKNYPGRAPLEAAAQGIRMKSNDVAFRCNLVTIKNKIMHDFTADHITTPIAKKIIARLDKILGNKKLKFYPGVSYRHLLIMNNGPVKAKCTPPHDITGKNIESYVPQGNGAKILTELMTASQDIVATSKSSATQIWLWGQGKAPKFEPITKRYKLKGTVITAVDLLKGLARCAGLNVVNVKGATGFLDTNYAGKVKAGLHALKKEDLLILHVEAPDECGHMGKADLKIKAIEDFDQKVVEPIVASLHKQKEDFRILILPDHPTPIELKTHSNDPVPFVFYDSTNEQPSTFTNYCEKTGAASNYYIPAGHTLLEKMINARF